MNNMVDGGEKVLKTPALRSKAVLKCWYLNRNNNKNGKRGH